MYSKWSSCLQDRIGKSTLNVLQNFDITKEKSESMVVRGHSKGFRRKENQKVNKSDHYGQKAISKINYDTSLTIQKFHGNVKALASLKMDEDSNNRSEYMDLECSFQKERKYGIQFPSFITY